jgi:hypothetical protein
MASHGLRHLSVIRRRNPDGSSGCRRRGRLPGKQTLEVEKDGDEFVIKLPSFRLQQFVVLKKD